MEDHAKLLSDFGLTMNQARVYVAIVKLGAAQVGDISKFSKVRREDVYRTLPKLEEMGLIEKTLGTPTKIRAMPLETALDFLIKRKQDETSNKMVKLAEEAKEFLTHFKSKTTSTTLEAPEQLFSLISEKNAILSKSSAMIKNSERQIDMISSRKRLGQLLYQSADLFRKAIGRGVTIRIVTEKPSDGDPEDPLIKLTKTQISTGPAIDIRYVEGLVGHYIIVDAREALIPSSEEVDLAESPSLWTNNSSLAGLLQKNFGDIWFFASMPLIGARTEAPLEKATRGKRVKPSKS